MEPTGIVDLFTMTVPGCSTGAISRTTSSTTERSAPPRSPKGVGTQRNTNSASRSHVRGADDEAEPTGVEAFHHQLAEPGLENRHIALLEPAHPCFVDVGAHDVVSEVREARRAREADVPRSDHCNLRRHHASVGVGVRAAATQQADPSASVVVVGGGVVVGTGAIVVAGTSVPGASVVVVVTAP